MQEVFQFKERYTQMVMFKINHYRDYPFSCYLQNPAITYTPPITSNPPSHCHHWFRNYIFNRWHQLIKSSLSKAALLISQPSHSPFTSLIFLFIVGQSELNLIRLSRIQIPCGFERRGWRSGLQWPAPL